jgi:hypothetical protein
MSPREIDQIALELCDLLQQQLDAILGRKLADFTPEELEAYEKRKARIAVLRRKLHLRTDAASRNTIPRWEPVSGRRAEI